jgi:hypothetical protein
VSILSTPERRDRASDRDRAAAEAAVTALYHEHALGLTRLAHVMLKDLIFLDTARPSGELLAASRVVTFTGKTPAGITYACFTSAVMSLDATTMTCAGAPSTDDGYKVQSVGIVTISARTGVPLRYMPMQRYNAWVTEHVAMLYWASPTGGRGVHRHPDELQIFGRSA